MSGDKGIKWHQKQQKKRIDKLDFFKIENFCKKVKRQPREWEKIFANCIFDKGLVVRIERTPTTQHEKDK